MKNLLRKGFLLLSVWTVLGSSSFARSAGNEPVSDPEAKTVLQRSDSQLQARYHLSTPELRQAYQQGQLKVERIQKGVYQVSMGGGMDATVLENGF